MRTFTRPSQHGGVPHVIHLVDDLSETIDQAHPCSCAAGAEGRICWALLEVLCDDVPSLTDEPAALELVKVARELRQARAAVAHRKSVRTGHATH